MDTKQQHTAEPWSILDEGDCIEIQNKREAVVSFYPDSSDSPDAEKARRDARRIVACVNACEGIDTLQLEILDVKTTIDGAHELIKQRDKLLHAAKFAVRVLAEENAGGTLESKRRMRDAQLVLFEAVKAADPAYYGLKG